MTMPPARPRVTLLGLSDEIGPILAEVLVDEGYQVDVVREPGSLDAAAAGAVVVALGPGPASLAVLDELRTAASTAAVPVIALASSEGLREQAQTSGNVYATLPMPFEVDDLVGVVATALARTPFEARVQQVPLRSESGLARGADYITREQRRLMLDWSQRIRQVEPFQTRPEIPTREFLDSLPRVLHALTQILSRREPPEIVERDEDLLGRIRAHADTRRRQGLPAEATVREYQMLRQVIFERLQTVLGPEDLVAIVGEVSSLMDAAVRITVAEYTALQSGSPERGAGYTVLPD
jgi:DNA-binding response OmpR family regulator